MRVRSSAASQPSRKRLAVAAGVAVVLLAGGGDVARRAVHGHGRWHALARAAYHWVKPVQASAAVLPTERADGPLVIFDDKLGDGWQDWSWGKKDFNHPAPVHSGQAAIFLAPGGNRGLYLHHDGFNTGGYGTLQAFIHGDATARLCLVGTDLKFGGYVALAKYLTPDPAGKPGWQRLQVPLAALGVPHGGQDISGLVFQPDQNAPLPLIVDDVSLRPDLSLPPAPTAATVSVSVNIAEGRHPISPYIYGMAFAPADYLADLRLGVNRWGGNDKSRYNWVQGNADNAARDWDFRNRFASDGGIPPGPSSAADRFVRENKAGGAATLLTVPTLGWVAKDTDNSHQSTNVPGNGGTGLAGADGPVAGYDPTDNRNRTSVRSVARKNAPFALNPVWAGGTVYQDEWVNHLKQTFGDSAHGGVQFFAMDNEPDLWDSTHTDVHPARMGYDDVLHNFLDYATAVKAVDPAALVTGPVSWGYTGFLYSALDRGTDNFAAHADRAAHGDEPFLPWFLKNVRTHDLRTGKRTLDVLDVHFYPQADGIYGSRDDKSAQALRLRTTRSLWDPTYRDESWIAKPVDLIPLLNGWIMQDYPGVKLGITEWNFGADSSMDGGLAIADVLGIYGRGDVYLANYWAFPPKNSPGYLAFKLYRNADGRGDGFGDVSCQSSSADQSRLSVYAATDSRTGDLTLMLVNKMPKATITAPLLIRGANPEGPVKIFRCDADNPKEIAVFPPAPLRSFLTLPPMSMTLVRVPLRK